MTDSRDEKRAATAFLNAQQDLIYNLWVLQGLTADKIQRELVWNLKLGWVSYVQLQAAIKGWRETSQPGPWPERQRSLIGQIQNLEVSMPNVENFGLETVQTKPHESSTLKTFQRVNDSRDSRGRRERSSKFRINSGDSFSRPDSVAETGEILWEVGKTRSQEGHEPQAHISLSAPASPQHFLHAALPQISPANLMHTSKMGIDMNTISSSNDLHRQPQSAFWQYTEQDLSNVISESDPKSVFRRFSLDEYPTCHDCGKVESLGPGWQVCSCEGPSRNGDFGVWALGIDLDT